MRRWLYFLAGSLALLIVTAVGALETLKSEMVRARIASALSSALGQSVTIGGLAIALFPVPSLSARQVQIGGADSMSSGSAMAPFGSWMTDSDSEMGPTGAELTLRSASIHPVDLPALFILAGMAPSPSLSIEGRAPFAMTISVAPGFASYTVTAKRRSSASRSAPSASRECKRHSASSAQC